MRHIAIVGMSFCGSTVLSYVLGALDGVANVGESHWIATPPQPGSSGAKCHTCGDACPVLTAEFCDSLREDPTNWYEKIAARLGTDILVTSDKNLILLRRNDPEANFDVVYSFRPPLDAYRSYQKSAKLQSKPLTFDEYLWFWTTFYGNAHYNFPSQGKKIWLNFSDFSANPEDQLSVLCGKLDIPYQADALRYWEKKQHVVGGNFNPYDAVANGKMDRVIISSRQSPPYSDEEVQGYEAHATAKAMYEAMSRWANARG